MKLCQNNHLMSTLSCWKINLIGSELWILNYFQFLRVSHFYWFRLYWSSSLFKTLRYLIVIKNEGQPKRTFYIAFGHDEEVGGHKGAKEIAKKLEEVLEQENEKLSFVLDEGMMVLDGVFPGISEPVAYVGKGKFEFYSF